MFFGQPRLHATVLLSSGAERPPSGAILFMADGNSLRGVNLMRVESGRIVEAMGYVKG